MFAFYNPDFCLPPFFSSQVSYSSLNLCSIYLFAQILLLVVTGFKSVRAGVRFFDNCFENNIFWRVEKAAESAFVTCYRDLQPVHALKISCFKTKLIHLWMKIVICIACLHNQLSFFFF